MHRILILDGSQDMARILKERVQDFDDYEETEVELAASSEEALEHATLASGVGRSYTMFLINQGLGSARDGITAMKELLEINPDSDAVIFNGFENSRERMQAYEAGAKRYLSKTSELKEILFVLKDIAQSSRKRIEEIRQRRQFMVAKEIAETAGAELNLERTMEAILQKLSEVFEETSLCVLPYDDKLNALKFAPATLMKQKKIQGFENWRSRRYRKITVSRRPCNPSPFFARLPCSIQDSAKLANICLGYSSTQSSVLQSPTIKIRTRVSIYP